MINNYFRLPIKFGELTQQKEHAKCSLAESVSEMIHLISVTSYGECKHDELFGCEIWEHDFENLINSQAYRDYLTDSIKKTIEKYEPRLTNIKVSILIEQIDSKVYKRRIKNRIQMKVEGLLALTNEPFSHIDQFFIGPLSYY